jgi:hypothetical protein
MSASVQRFAASWSAATWLITLLVIVVAIVAMGAVLKQVEHISPGGGWERALLTLAALLLPVILMVTVIFAPLGYTVDNAGIMVNRMGRNICVPYAEIADIRLVDRRDVSFAIRVCGCGGFFGFYGRFWSKRLGKFHAYVTDTRQLVLITCTDGRKILLSPFPADVFTELVRSMRSQSEV